MSASVAGGGIGQPLSAARTAGMISLMLTGPPPSVSDAEHAPPAVLPNAAFTPSTSSSMVTDPFALQSPGHGVGTVVGAGDPVGVGVPSGGGTLVTICVYTCDSV